MDIVVVIMEVDLWEVDVEVEMMVEIKGKGENVVDLMEDPMVDL